MELIDLDEGVMNALDFFITNPNYKQNNMNPFKRPLVVGSGNAKVVGDILFTEQNAILADESNYLQKLGFRGLVDGCVIISASGAKHAPKIAKKIRKKGLRTVLFTNNKHAIAKRYVDKTFVFPKITEPYTYNISTYLSMILSKTKEDPKKIKMFLQKITPKIPTNLKKYDAFFILIPESFYAAAPMIRTKFEELFGPKISARIYTYEHAKHAETLVNSDKELFISFGKKNTLFGKHRLNLPLPSFIDIGGFIAYTYYLVGFIQRQNPPYYKQNVEAYTKKASKMFGHTIKPLVD